MRLCFDVILYSSLKSLQQQEKSFLSPTASVFFMLIGFNITFILGQIFTALKAPEKALAAYKTCYQLDTAQKDILETICNLLIELPVDAGMPWA